MRLVGNFVVIFVGFKKRWGVVNVEGRKGEGEERRLRIGKEGEGEEDGFGIGRYGYK